MNYVIFFKLFYSNNMGVSRRKRRGRAIRCKSSHFLRQAPGFSLLSLTRNDFRRHNLVIPRNEAISHGIRKSYSHNICHFDGGEISTSSSTKIDFRYGVTCEDFSSVEMTNCSKNYTERYQPLSNPACDPSFVRMTN